MSKKYLDTVGLNKLVANILSKFAAKNHSHSNATTNSAGFMSSSDKVKLDGVAAGANRTIVDSSLNGTSTNAIQNKAVKTALDGKASSSHTHPTAQITGLDSALAGKASASHKHDAGNITSGTLPIGRGGTGAGTADAALKNLMDNCTIGGTAAPSDDLWYFTANLDAAQPPVKRKHSALWSYIKSKTDPLYQPRGSYAAASHTHSIANITNLQSQLDSKQPKGSYAASSHTHTISNVTNLQTELDKKQVKIQPVTTTGTGSAYTATVSHIKTLATGVSFTMIPNVVSAAVSPTLNVNNLGAKPIRQRLSNGTVSTATGATANWLAAGKPVDVMYDGQFWVVDFVRPNMASAYGTLPVENGGVPKIREYADWSKVLKSGQGTPSWGVPDGKRVLLFDKPDNTSTRIMADSSTYPSSFSDKCIDYLIVTVRNFMPSLPYDALNTMIVPNTNKSDGVGNGNKSFLYASGLIGNDILTGVLVGNFLGTDFYPSKTLKIYKGASEDLNLNYVSIVRVEALVNDKYELPLP